MAIHKSTQFCNCPDCPTNKHVSESNCKEECPRHGPFPTQWKLHNAYTHLKDGEFGVLETWERYVGEYKIESKHKFRTPILEG